MTARQTQERRARADRGQERSAGVTTGSSRRSSQGTRPSRNKKKSTDKSSRESGTGSLRKANGADKHGAGSHSSSQNSSRARLSSKRTRRNGDESGSRTSRARGGSSEARVRDSHAAGTGKSSGALERFVGAVQRHKLLTVLIVVVLCIAAVYPVGQRYYETMRTEQLYEAQAQAVQARNDAIKQENDSLKTDEGVEAEAHEQLGWTKDGEQSAVVTNAGDSSSSSSDLPSEVDLSDVDVPHTWYYDILDVIFFVNTEELG
jgi:cell division protein FtsB